MVVGGGVVLGVQCGRGEWAEVGAWDGKGSLDVEVRVQGRHGGGDEGRKGHLHMSAGNHVSGMKSVHLAAR